jgi:GNAT superfamily N-acetyltransferase
MAIRAVEPRDAVAVANIFLAARAGMTYLPRLHSDDDTRAYIRHVVVQELETWVCENEGRVVGFGALSGDMLEHLYVHPDAQGRGVGTDLLAHAKRLRPGGFRLWVFQKNERARRFYERNGFFLAELTDGGDNEEREPDALYEWSPSPQIVSREGWRTAPTQPVC